MIQHPVPRYHRFAKPPAARLLALVLSALSSAAMAADMGTAASQIYLQGMNAPAGAQMTAPESGWPDPSLAMGLAGIADWETQQPFINVMKSARPWFGHMEGRWGGVEHADLRRGGYLDDEGWPIAIPDGVTALETLILTDMPADAQSMAGRYHVAWNGKGDLTIGGRATNVLMNGQSAVFDFTPGEGPVSLTLSSTDADDPLRNIRVIREDHLPLAAAGALFNPDWLNLIRDMRLLRFMDWMQTNNSPQTTWDDRPLPTDMSFEIRGVPLEYMIALANLVGADPWFTLPHQADDDYVAQFARMVHDRLDPRLVVHAEWSNELWNFIFSQAHWAREQAEMRWGGNIPDDGWMQYAGTRAAEVADIWADTFQDAPDRLTRVIATHTGWPGLEEPLLTAPLRQAQGLPAPAQSFDAYAITGYFGFEIGPEDSIPAIHAAIAAGTFTQDAHATILAGSLREMTDTLWPYHAKSAAAHGLDLMMYEGGTHVVASGAGTQDDSLTDALTAFNYSPEMADLYARSIATWRQLTPSPYMAFVDVGRASRWGSWGALRHLDDTNPRWATLAGWNSLPQGALATDATGQNRPARAADAFTYGLLMADPPPDSATITGTAKADILLGSAGDDVIIANGGDDLINGGEGRDRVILSGKTQDWSPATDGSALWMFGTTDRIRLVGIEEISFADDPATILQPRVTE